MKAESKTIVEALRVLAVKYLPEEEEGLTSEVIMEAADRIEELEAELAKACQVLDGIGRFLKAEKEKGDAK